MSADAPDRRPDRYYVTTDARGEREVDKAEYIRVEQGAGFRSKGGPNFPATASFGSSGIHGSVSGRIQYAWTDEIDDEGTT